MPCAYSIRPAKLTDADELALVHVRCWQTTYRGIFPDSFMDTLEQTMLPRRKQLWAGILAKPPDVKEDTLVMVADEQIVGFTSTGPNRDQPVLVEGEIYAIYLLAEFRKIGLGRPLFEAAVKCLQRRGLNRYSLWVADKNPTRGFYEHLGGVESGEQFDHVEGLPVREVRYVWR